MLNKAKIFLRICAINLIMLAMEGQSIFANDSASLPALHHLFFERIKEFEDTEHYASVLSKAEFFPIWSEFYPEELDNRFISLLDSSYMSNRITQSIESSISENYHDFVNNSEWGRIDFKITPEVNEKREYDNIVSQLFKYDTTSHKWIRVPSYEQYHELLTNYRKLKKKFDETPEEQRTGQQKRELKRARESLESEGEQSKYIGFESKLKEFLAYDFSKYKKQIHDLYYRHTSNGKKPITNLKSKYYEAESNLSWKEFKHKINPQKIFEVDKGFGSLLPETCFYVPDEGHQYYTLECPNELTIQGEIAVVSIERNWFFDDISVVASGWRWLESNHEKLSTGKVGVEKLAKAPLTTVPYKIFILKNISIEGNFSKEFITDFLKLIRNHRHIRFGSLFLAGFTKVAGENLYIQPVLKDRRTIAISGYHVVGFLSRVLPEMPTDVEGIIWNEPFPEFPFAGIQSD